MQSNPGSGGTSRYEVYRGRPLSRKGLNTDKKPQEIGEVVDLKVHGLQASVLLRQDDMTCHHLRFQVSSGEIGWGSAGSEDQMSFHVLSNLSALSASQARSRTMTRLITLC